MVVRSLMAAVMAAVVLAGCSESPAQEQDPTPLPTETFSVVADNRLPPPTTDTYHLLALPRVTPLAPDSYEPVRVPVRARHPYDVSESPTPWSFTLPHDLVGLQGTATIFVEVKGTLTGNPFSMTTGGCFWTLRAVVKEQDITLACLTDDLQIEPGLYELVFEFVEDLDLERGTQVHLELTTFESGPRAPDATAEVLTAAIGHDSRIRLYGLQVPLDAELLLLTG